MLLGVISEDPLASDAGVRVFTRRIQAVGLLRATVADIGQAVNAPRGKGDDARGGEPLCNDRGHQRVHDPRSLGLVGCPELLTGHEQDIRSVREAADGGAIGEIATDGRRTAVSQGGFRSGT